MENFTNLIKNIIHLIKFKIVILIIGFNEIVENKI